MKYLSVCSGIEAATAAWHPLGWEPFAFSEIEKFPSQVLAHRYPDVPNLGDMTKFKEWPDAAIDVLVGGTPCQSFSVAGLRKGLDDPRGNLMLTYLAIADKYRPEWLVWENVPGVLSSNGGRDFASLLRGMGELGYGFAYRVLDAQYFGVAQRRRRVFVIGCLGSWQRAAAVLFERHSLQGHPAPSREKGQEVTHTIRAGAANGGKGHGARSGDSRDELIVPIARCDTAGEGKRQDYETCTLVAHSLRGEGFDASEDGTGRGTPLVPVRPYTLAIRGRGDSYNLEYRQDGTANALLTPNGGRGGIGVGAVAAPIAWSEELTPSVDLAGTIQRGGAGGRHDGVFHAMQVRRLTPRECERLQGFEDDYTDIRPNGKPTSDGPRYKALGNSMAVPVMHRIGRRIQAVSAIQRMEAAA